MEFANLKASRKVDRQIIAGHFLRVAHQYGAEIESREEGPSPGFHGPSIALRFKLGGVGAMIDVDDLHERHGHKGSLLSWYNEQPGRAPSRDFAGAFNRAVRDFGQYRPHHKASSSGSWAELLEAFAAGLALAYRNEAFIERKAA